MFRSVSFFKIEYYAILIWAISSTVGYSQDSVQKNNISIEIGLNKHYGIPEQVYEKDKRIQLLMSAIKKEKDRQINERKDLFRSSLYMVGGGSALIMVGPDMYTYGFIDIYYLGIFSFLIGSWTGVVSYLELDDPVDISEQEEQLFIYYNSKY